MLDQHPSFAYHACLVKSVTQPVYALGHQGAKESGRSLSSTAVQDQVRLRTARLAFRKYHAQCFWFLRPDMPLTIADIPEVVRGLRQNGGRQGFLLAANLCR